MLKDKDIDLNFCFIANFFQKVLSMKINETLIFKSVVLFPYISNGHNH